ncbi:Superoxide dismutase [Purpureocillium takamizusanense]|uniref:superoxide dismutase n=1 Tax=Purpureocillium takamizusanense TaxID=2060973 RepID=A0A9Q8Q9B8_9HYPO|nr:Superoxide dismutase [Purpureocillium takamizusanense]UNI14938.1 Superoxide dismutase [Purpureocillium takamizusanense]
MRASGIATAVVYAAVAAAQATQDAPVINGNPAGVAYKAVLPNATFFHVDDLVGNVKGVVVAETPADGVGVKFTVEFSNLPKSGGPFPYHIHVDPVPSDGNCTKTLAHLDPYIRGEKPPCDAATPEKCQVGDLSGKHGKITADPFRAEYVDKFSSLKEGEGSFFGNRSFVLHFGNTTRISCASFVKVPGNGTNTTTKYPTQAPTSAPTSTVSRTGSAGLPTTTGVPPTSTVVPIAAAALSSVSLPLMVVAAAAAFFAL